MRLSNSVKDELGSIDGDKKITYEELYVYWTFSTHKRRIKSLLLSEFLIQSDHTYITLTR